jgi:RHS repeat-associated protein
MAIGSYAYDNQDRATTVGALAPTWDARDNALNPGYGKTYGWDRRNRLVKVTAGTVTTLGYDAEGLRVSKQVGSGSVTNYLVDTFSPTGYPQVLVEYTGTGTGRQPQRTYTYGLDLISQRTVAGGLVEFFSNDAFGTTRFLTRFDPGVTSLDGQMGELTTQTFTYDAYGLLASGSATATAYLYTGEQWDNDVRAYYLRARWYLPEWGRFLSRDTIEGTINDPLSLHKFLYASANPVNLVDPSGHDPGVGTLPGLLGGIGIRGVGEGLRLPTVSASFVKAAITVGVVAVAVTSDTPDRSDRNAMRLQLQEGNNHYWSLVMSEEARGIGVVSPQVYAALSSLHFAATTEAMLLDFPTSLEPELYGAIIRFSSRIRPIVAGGGVVQGGNVLREEFRGNGRTYRIDLENLRGHNLRR